MAKRRGHGRDEIDHERDQRRKSEVQFRKNVKIVTTLVTIVTDPEWKRSVANFYGFLAKVLGFIPVLFKHSFQPFLYQNLEERTFNWT